MVVVVFVVIRRSLGLRLFLSWIWIVLLLCRIRFLSWVCEFVVVLILLVWMVCLFLKLMVILNWCISIIRFCRNVVFISLVGLIWCIVWEVWVIICWMVFLEMLKVVVLCLWLEVLVVIVCCYCSIVGWKLFFFWW